MIFGVNLIKPKKQNTKKEVNITTIKQNYSIKTNNFPDC